MSMNNNQGYGYGNRYQGDNGRSGNSYRQGQSVTYNYQSGEQLGQSTGTPLLPYHQYMASKNKSASSTPGISSINPPKITQHYSTTTEQPYFYQSSTYQSQPFIPQQSSYNYASTTPLQPYSAYMQQKLQQSSGLNSYEQSSQITQKIQSSTNYGTIDNNVKVMNSPIKQQQKSSPRQTPSPSPTPIKQNPNIPTPKKQRQTQERPTYQKNHDQKPPSNHCPPNHCPSNHYESNPNHHNCYSQNYYPKTRKDQQDDYNMDLSSDGWSEQQQQEEILYQKYQSRKYNKSKTIQKKKDSTQDNPEEIRKWIEARKRNYPGLRKKLSATTTNFTPQNQLTEQRQKQIGKEKQQMSKLQSKIRKKLLIINGDSRSIMKKIKNIQILRRIVQNPQILTRERKPRPNQSSNQQLQNNHQIKSQLLNQIIDEKERVQQEKQSKVESSSKIVQEEGQIMEEALEQVVPEHDHELVPEHEHELGQELTNEKQKDNSSSSDSQQSIQPQQLPANKTSHQQLQLPPVEQTLKPTPSLFQVIPKPQPTQSPSTPSSSKQLNTKKQSKPLDPESIIAHLKQKQQEDKQSLNKLFDYRTNSHSYNYRVQTLQTSLKLDSIFAESTYLLQAIRYIVKESFFDP